MGAQTKSQSWMPYDSISGSAHPASRKRHTHARHPHPHTCWLGAWCVVVPLAEERRWLLRGEVWDSSFAPPASDCIHTHKNTVKHTRGKGLFVGIYKIV